MCLAAAQQGFCLAQPQGEHDTAAGEFQAMQARHGQGPGRAQFPAQYFELWPTCMQDVQVGGGERMFFQRQIVQAATVPRIGVPGGPGGEEVEAGAEAGFQDDEAFPVLPAPWQIVALQEYMSCLAWPPVRGVVDVAIGCTERGAIASRGEAGGGETVQNLESPVEHARVCVWRVVWQGATTRMVDPCKEKQRSQAARQACNRVRSGFTQRMSVIEGANLNVHETSRGNMSGQLGNQG